MIKRQDRNRAFGVMGKIQVLLCSWSLILAHNLSCFCTPYLGTATDSNTLFRSVPGVHS